jgi:hypothetical protein
MSIENEYDRSNKFEPKFINHVQNSLNSIKSENIIESHRYNEARNDHLNVFSVKGTVSKQEEISNDNSDNPREMV